MERYKDKEMLSTYNPTNSTLVVSFNSLHNFTLFPHMIH